MQRDPAIAPEFSQWVSVLTHSAIRPIGQWDATAGWAGPYTNGANDRPIAQPIHQSVSSIIISYETM